MKKIILYLLLAIFSAQLVLAGSGNPLGPYFTMGAPTGYTAAPGEYELGDQVTICVKYTNHGNTSHNLNPMLWGSRVTKTACTEDVTDADPAYTETQLDHYHQTSCDEQTFLGILDSSPYVSVAPGANKTFCFKWTPPSVGYYQCDATGNVDGHGYESYAWCFIRVKSTEIPEFSGVAAGIAMSGAGAAYMLLRRRK